MVFITSRNRQEKIVVLKISYCIRFLIQYFLILLHVPSGLGLFVCVFGLIM